jgi:ketosteroid isomerase-like protein
MTTNDIAVGLVEFCKNFQLEEAVNAYYSEDIVSTEAMPGDMQVVRGLAAVRAKTEWWDANNEVHSMKTEGPWINGDQFIVRFDVDLTDKTSGQRWAGSEMALYSVKDGKIVSETFFMPPMA